MAGVTVRARHTIKRNGVYITPGTVFDLPDQKTADHLIARGVVSAKLEDPIVATPEFEITPTGAKREIPPEEAQGAADAPPASFTDAPAGAAPAAPQRGRGRR
jgi:hypothetical protein